MPAFVPAYLTSGNAGSKAGIAASKGGSTASAVDRDARCDVVAEGI
jgi:hypothetical protein